MNIFVDGSFSPQKQIGIGAYVILNSDDLHLLLGLSITELKIKLDEKSLTIYTDCQKTTRTSEYNVVHVKGHAKQINRNGVEKIFDVIDKASRKHLRGILKET